MDIEFVLNVADAVMIVGIGIPTGFIARKIEQRKLRNLTLLLAGFLIFHGLYHITAALGGVSGFDFAGSLADVIVEPLSWILFLSFAVFFARNS